MQIEEEESAKQKTFTAVYTFAPTRILLERFVWILLAFAPIFKIVLSAEKYRDKTVSYPYKGSIDYSLLILDNYLTVVASVAIALFPILFSIIFGSAPFEFLRRKYNPAVFGIQEPYSYEALKGIKESNEIAERIFSRSGAYLLIGCLIAFIGVAIFYAPLYFSSPISSSESNYETFLLAYLPRFGALFFVEFIAFFFLKQYRIMLEEYRYYESVKRHRQDDYAIIQLIKQYSGNTELLKVLTENINKPKSSKLLKDETTEILETQKLIDKDLDIFAKFVEVVKLVKK